MPASLVECHAVIRAQAQLLSQLQAQVALLQERINLDSKNSSKPPSTDGLGRGNRAQRRASQRQRGAQPGHKGHTRAMLDEGEVDCVVDCKPEAICECGGSVELADAPRRHQVFEVCHPCVPRSMSTACTADAVRAAARRTQACCRRACPGASWACGHCRWWVCWARGITWPSARSATCSTS